MITRADSVSVFGMDNFTILMMMHTIGLSIIAQELKRALYIYEKPNYHPKTASDSLAFIQGTGLEIVIDYYHLEYDADAIRNVFFSMVGDHEKISYLRNRVPSQGRLNKEMSELSGNHNLRE